MGPIGKGSDAGKDGRQKEKGAAEDEVVGRHHCLNGHEYEQTPGDSGGQKGLMGCSPWGCKEPDTAQQLHNSNNNPAETYSPRRGERGLDPREAGRCIKWSVGHALNLSRDKEFVDKELPRPVPLFITPIPSPQAHTALRSLECWGKVRGPCVCS